MTSFMVEDLDGTVIYSGQADFSPGQDVVVSSSVGSARHKVDASSALIKISLPFRGEVSEWSPPEDEGQLTFMVESAGSAAERTEKEMEENRVDGTIKPQDQRPAGVETEEVTVNTQPTQEEIEAAQAASEDTSQESEFELS